jgi:membrane-associated phospholipid phosphatase
VNVSAIHGPVVVVSEATFAQRLIRAGVNLQRWLWRPALTGIALLALAVPAQYVRTRWYPVVFGVPLVISAFRQKSGAFRWWAAYVLGFVAFALLRNSADDLGFPLQSAYVLRMDRWLGAGVLPTIRLQAWHSPALNDLAALVYISYFIVPAAIALVLWAFDAARFRRYVLASLALFGAALVCHMILPTAPPWMASEWGLLPGGHRILVDVLHQHASSDAAMYAGGLASGNPVAAMPSLHLAAIWLVALVGWDRSVTRWFGMAYTLAMGLSLIYLGEHWVIDEVGGVLIATLAWWAVTIPWSSGRQSE